VRCEKQRYALFQPEPEYWLILVINNPTVKDSADGKTQYLDDELDDAVLQAIVRRCYSTFKLYNGNIVDIVAEHGIEQLKDRFNLFMRYFIPTVNFSQLAVFTDIHGFQFLPVDRTTFLTIQYVINLVASTFPAIESIAVTFGGKLIYSSIQQEDVFLLYSLEQEATAPMYNYLAFNTLLFFSPNNKYAPSDVVYPSSAEDDPSEYRFGSMDYTVMDPTHAPPSPSSPSSSRTAPSSTSSLSSSRGKHRERGPSSSGRAAASSSGGVKIPHRQGFLTGPRRVSDPACTTAPAAPRVFIKGKNEGSDLRLVVYRRFAITLFCVVDVNADVQQRQTESERASSPSQQAREHQANRTGGGGQTATKEGNQPLESQKQQQKQQEKEKGPGEEKKEKEKEGNEGKEPPPQQQQQQQEGEETEGAQLKQQSGQQQVQQQKQAETLPPASFYDDLASFVEGNLKKLSKMLNEQTEKIAGLEDSFIFLYFNHMNLALKTTLNTKQARLTMETIKLIRRIHHEFKTTGSWAKGATASGPASNGVEQKDCEGESNSVVLQEEQLMSLGKPRKSWRSYGISEMCVKTRSNGWVVGRRATQSHREFFVLVDDRAGSSLTDIQEEVEKLTKTYFYNIFIH